jgi:acylpyruvate hydrolase
MRLATVRTADGRTSAAVDDAGTWRALPAANLGQLLTTDPGIVHAGSLSALDQLRLLGTALPGALPCSPLPRPSKVVCCGLNYADHITEMGRQLPEFPTLFAKFADTLTGPTDPIEVPAGVDLDWEGELAVVVGRTVRRADPATAREAIAGYTVANDISVRDWQNRTLQWLQGKAWDATTPVGPVVVTPDEVDPEAGLEVTCEVNGETVQRGNTRSLVFGPAALVSYISQFTTLRPGDLVLTGTPGGVGMGLTPPRFLRDGDVVRTHVEGIGALENTIRLTHTTPEETP